MCYFRSWSSLDISNRSYTENLALISNQMYQIHTELRRLSNNTARSLRTIPPDEMTSSISEHEVNNLMYLHDSIEDTLVWIPTTPLYDFTTYAENSIGLNFQLFLAQDIMENQLWFQAFLDELQIRVEDIELMIEHSLVDLAVVQVAYIMCVL